MPYRAAEGAARVVRRDGQAVQRRGTGCGQWLVGLGVLERLDQTEVPRQLLLRRALQQEVMAACGRLVAEGERGLREGGLGDSRRGARCGVVEVLQEGAAEVAYWTGGVDGDVGEAREVLAQVGEGGEVADGGVGEEDEGDGLALDLSRDGLAYLVRIRDVG